MAMTQTGLLILGTLGTLAGIGTLREFGDTATTLVVKLVATVTWILFSFASLDVIVRDNYAATASEPMWPFVFLGAALGMVAFASFIDALLTALGSSAGASKSGGLMRE